ncbi:hypothetical protein [Ascidiimonas aurantiaca]
MEKLKGTPSLKLLYLILLALLIVIGLGLIAYKFGETLGSSF